MSNKLIAYFSWSGNAQQLAKQIQAETAGDLFHIEPLEPYPSSYVMTATRAVKEQHQNKRPELALYLEHINGYDTVYLVYPNWCGTVPMAVCTFLDRYDFGGKHIMPLCTSGGSGIQRSIQAITTLCPGAQVHEGLLIADHLVASSAAAEQVKIWIAGG